VRRAERDGRRPARPAGRGKPLGEKILELAHKASHARTKAGDPKRAGKRGRLSMRRLGVERPDEVLLWLERYLSNEGLTAFELASTRRQLVEVWQLDAGVGIGKEVLPLVETKLLGRAAPRSS
jgi:hypothetical protein